MKISKIFAGMSAIAIAATAAMSVSANTITIDTPNNTEWASCFSNDDFVDASTFTKDTALDVTVNFTWTDAGKEANYCAFKPCFANGWGSYYTADPSYLTGLSNKDDFATNDDNALINEDGSLVKVAIQSDGFVQVYDTETTSVSFTISADAVNAMIDNASAEDGFDGFLIQVGNNGLNITSIEFSQDVKMNSTVNAEAGTGDESTPDSTTDSTTSTTDSTTSSTTSSTSSTTSSTASTSSASGTTTKTTTSTATAGTTSTATSDNTANAESGAVAGVGLAVAALAGAAIVVSRKK